MDDDALSEAATPPASPRTSTADIVLDDEETVELGPKLTKATTTATTTSRETRSKSRGTTSGELTGNLDPVRSLQELADSVLQPARDDNSNVLREQASRQLRQRAQ
eukprot:3256160-Rhodomonas_salina.1